MLHLTTQKLRPRISSLPLMEISAGLLFFTAATAALLLTRVAGGSALIWPANAIAASIFIRLPRVRWISAAVILWTTNVAANLLFADRSWGVSALLSGTNVAETALMVWVFRSLVRFNYPDISVNHATMMITLIGIAIPGIMALVGGAVLHEAYNLPFAATMAQWWLAHTLGACLLGPPILLFSFNSLRRLLARTQLRARYPCVEYLWRVLYLLEQHSRYLNRPDPARAYTDPLES